MYYKICFLLLILWNTSLQAQSNKSYLLADSLFVQFAKNKNFYPDSIPLLSLSPTDFKQYIIQLEQKQLAILDSFLLQNNIDSINTNLLIAKINYKNITHILQHPIANGFFEVQEDEDLPEEIKGFYRESYQDYSLFLDTLVISNERYLEVKEYISFLDEYLLYQERRFYVFNTVEKCTIIDRYWLVRLLFTGQVRKFMADRVIKELQSLFTEKELEKVLKDFERL